MTAEAEVTRTVLMYFVLPLWLLVGFADYLCHRASHIATTSGPKKSLIHLIMLGEFGIAVTAAMSFEINATIILLMIIVWATHEATRRPTTAQRCPRRRPARDTVPRAIGLGPEAPRFEIVWKEPPLPWTCVLPVIAATIVFEVLPYFEEFIRGLRAWSRSCWIEHKS
jgi:hypothetical protein